MLEQIIAYRAYEIIAEWDGMAPDAHVAYVGTKELAEEVVSILNERPRSVPIVVDGFEYCKKFRYDKAIVEKPSQAQMTLKDVMGGIWGIADWQPGYWGYHEGNKYE